MLLAPSVALADGSSTSVIKGKVVDQSGATIVGAQVGLLDAKKAELRRAVTDGEGQFNFNALAEATYFVRVGKAGFLEVTRPITVSRNEELSVEFGLDIDGLSEAVTVTPARGESQEIFETPQSISIATADEISRRAFLILPQALKEEPGVHVQQTTTSQGSIFIRGLSGQQIVTLINGVRFNNATLRPGANQYLAFIDPAFAGRLEIVRGANSSQYGSDSLGGTINVLTSNANGTTERTGLHGGFSSFFGSADLSAGGSAHLSGGGQDWGFVIAGSGRRTQDLRPGGGIDSHSVVTRLFGLSSNLLGDRLQDTAYTQYGANAKFMYRASEADILTFEYLRGTQLGVRRYDQLDGGLGNLLNRFDPQVLDFFTARYDRIGLGFLDSLSATFSFNGQRDDRTSQSINNAQGLRSKITNEYNRTNSFGYQAQARTHLWDRSSITFGSEFYDEHIISRRSESSFNTGLGDFSNVAAVRARFPNGARYQTFGLFAQSITSLIREKLTGTVGLRYSRVRYAQSPAGNPLGANGAPTVPTYNTSLGDATFNTGLVYTISEHFNLTGNLSRGFRAPNVSDFGSVGISGLGFEITPEEGERLGGAVGRFDPSKPEGTGHKSIGQLKPEKNLTYDFGVKFRSARGGAALAVFDSELSDLIERRVVLLPQGATGLLIGEQQIVRQDSSGAVYTALSSSPVFVRANANRVRLRGVEGSFQVKVTRALTFSSNASYVRGTDLETKLPPSLENGIPPLTGFSSLKWEPTDRQFWLEAYSNFAASQRRFSDNDLLQPRIGGIRTRPEIVNFFNNGAVARGLVSNGILLSTGETAAQVWLRVLGPDPNARIPLYTQNPGFATFNLRGGRRLGENSTVTLILENVFDKNYRTMGSGIDAPGINAFVRYSYKF
jgi:hemoglobin/transferrin/lactoferrin receptor protein